MRPRAESHVLDRRIGVFAAARHDVAAKEDLLVLGLGEGGIETRLASGRIHLVHRGVYAIGRRELSRHGVWLAAVLAGGPGALLSHRSAAALWGLVRGDGMRTDVILPSRNGRSRRRGIAFHRPRQAPLEHECTVYERIPVTTPARTLLDLAGILEQTTLCRAIERSETLRIFDLRALERVVADHARSVNARRLVRALDLADPAPTPRELEQDFLDLCRANGVPRPQVNVLIAGLEVDFFWREPGLVVETDGFATHGTRAAFERDRERDATLARVGLTVLRFTHRRVTRAPREVASVILDVLARRRGTESRSGVSGQRGEFAERGDLTRDSRAKPPR